MSGEPTQTEICGRRVIGAKRPNQASSIGSAGSLPEASPSASDDIRRLCRQGPCDVAPRSWRKGRLVFALDATMSRQPTWDMACALQADMFREAAALGSLDIRLVYYRGLNECRASGWISDTAQLAKLMARIDCRGGNTQIGKVLSESAAGGCRFRAVRAVVFVGDAMEEKVDDLCRKAGELGLLKVPVFMFQEGHDGVAEQAFREIARLTGVHGAGSIRGGGATARTAARRGGLCRRRPRGVAAAVEDRKRCGQTARTDEMIVPSRVLMCLGGEDRRPSMLFAAGRAILISCPP